MVVETRIANPQQMFVVWLPLHGIFGQGMLPIFQGKLVLENIDQSLLACQTVFTIEQEIPKASIPRLGKPSCLANRRKSTIHVVRFKLFSRHPTEDLCWRMTTIFSFLVCKVVE